MVIDTLQTWHRELINSGLLVEVLEYRDPPPGGWGSSSIYVQGVLSVFDELVSWELATPSRYEILGRVRVTSHNAVSTAPYIWMPSVCQCFSLTVVGSMSRFTEAQIKTFRHAMTQLVVGNGQPVMLDSGHYSGRHIKSNRSRRSTEADTVRRQWADAAKFWGLT